MVLLTKIERLLRHRLANKKWRKNNPSYSKELYWKNIEKSRKNGRDNYHKDIEKNRKKSREQYYKHRERNLEYCREKRQNQEYKKWHREYKKIWEQKNKDKKSAYYKKWYVRNGKEYHKQWREKNKEILNQKRKEEYANNKELNSIYRRRSYLKNHQRNIIRCRKWREENKELFKKLAKLNNLRRQKLGYIDINIFQKLYEDNIKQFGTLTCILCFKPIEFGQDSIEHKIPVSRGGTNQYENLGIAHKICNIRKHNSTMGEWFGKQIKEKELWQIKT